MVRYQVAFVVLVVGAWGHISRSAICQVETPGSSEASVQPLTAEDIIARLRRGEVEGVRKAGQDAMPALILATATDGQAAAQILSMLNKSDPAERWMIPVFLAGLRHSDPQVVEMARAELSKFGRKWQNKSPQIALMIEAVCQPRRLQSPLKFLDQANLSADEKLAILRGLYPLGSTGIPRPTSVVAFEGHEVLGKILAYGPQGVPTLLDVVLDLKAPDLGVRQLNWTPQLVSSVVGHLEDSDAQRRRAAAWLLLNSVPLPQLNLENPNQLSKLMDCLDDEDTFVRRYVLEILAQQPPPGEEAFQEIIARLADTDSANRSRAAGLLSGMASAYQSEIYKLAEHGSVWERWGALSALSALPSVTEETLRLLVLGARDNEAEVRQIAVYGLERSGKSNDEIVAVLVESVRDPWTVYSAARALGAMGPAVAHVVPKLSAQLERVDPETRITLAVAICRIDPRSRHGLPVLQDLLGDTRTPRGGYDAAWTMDRAVPGESRYPLQGTIAIPAAEALGELGAMAGPATPALIKAARSDDQALSSAAVSALGEIGPAAKEAVPMLREMARAKPWPNKSAREALFHIDPTVPEAERTVFPAAPLVPADKETK